MANELEAIKEEMDLHEVESKMTPEERKKFANELMEEINENLNELNV